MKSDKIQSAIGGIDPDLIEAADQKQPAAKRSHIWRGVGLAAACLALVVMAVSVPKLLNRSGSNPAAQPSSNAIPNDAENDMYGWYLLPGGIRPEILVNGKLYYWDRFAYPLASDQTEGIFINATGDTVLPEGFTPIGEISSVTENPPAEDKQMKAGFFATGTVFTNEASPEVVYVLLDADCFDREAPYYIRFISGELDVGYRILCNGCSYLIRIGDGTCEVLKELPAGCVEVGKLHYIGLDLLPENDLETNCPNDTYSKTLEGRQVYIDYAEPEFLYLYEKQYWAEGCYDAYLKCPLLP